MEMEVFIVVLAAARNHHNLRRAETFKCASRRLRRAAGSEDEALFPDDGDGGDFRQFKEARFVSVVAVERAVQPFDDDVDVAEFRRRRREFTAERASLFFVRNRHVEDVVISVQKKVFDFVAALLV